MAGGPVPHRQLSTPNGHYKRWLDHTQIRILTSVRTRPPDLSDADVGAAVAEGWAIEATTIDYVPLGFGSHHWQIAETSGKRWFVTADAVADSAGPLADLTTALTTAHALRHNCGLEFVVAPLPGAVHGLVMLTGRYVVALYPYVERSTDAPAEPQQVLRMAVALHAATVGVLDSVSVDDLSIRDRPSLEAVLAHMETEGDAGPFAADFAALVRDHREPITAALVRHDAEAGALKATRNDWVVTHGELKPNNTMVTAAGPVLVDWDTVQLAPPARDVWMLDSVSDYVGMTGRVVTARELDFYRRRWDLKDLCGSAVWFTHPHERTTDTEMAWQGSIKICRRLAEAKRQDRRIQREP